MPPESGWMLKDSGPLNLRADRGLLLQLRQYPVLKNYWSGRVVVWVLRDFWFEVLVGVLLQLGNRRRPVGLREQHSIRSLTGQIAGSSVLSIGLKI